MAKLKTREIKGINSKYWDECTEDDLSFNSGDRVWLAYESKNKFFTFIETTTDKNQTYHIIEDAKNGARRYVSTDAIILHTQVKERRKKEERRRKKLEREKKLKEKEQNKKKRARKKPSS